MNYKGHTLTNTLALVPTIYLLDKHTNIDPKYIAAAAIGYLIGTLFISPDLDVYSRPYQNWKWLRFLWLPYQKMIRHRSKLTHSPIIGTLFRSMYLFLVFSMFYFLLAEPFGLEEFKIRPENYPLGLAALLGIEAASVVHIITDYISSKLK